MGDISKFVLGAAQSAAPNTNFGFSSVQSAVCKYVDTKDSDYKQETIEFFRAWSIYSALRLTETRYFVKSLAEHGSQQNICTS